MPICIPETEHRAISLKQLREVVDQIQERCEREHWKSTDPQNNKHHLKPEEVTLYDLVEYLIKPQTQPFECSYVELVASQQQPPDWFVSHWWGEPVLDFCECLEQHAKDRGLSLDDTFYWVCAYANNQHNVLGEVGLDPRESSFYKGRLLLLSVLPLSFSLLFSRGSHVLAFLKLTKA